MTDLPMNVGFCQEKAPLGPMNPLSLGGEDAPINFLSRLKPVYLLKICTLPCCSQCCEWVILGLGTLLNASLINFIHVVGAELLRADI